MNTLTKRRLYFIVAIVAIVAILVNIFYTFFMPGLEGTSIEYIANPVKEIIFSQGSLWILFSFIVLLATAALIDKIINSNG